MSEDVVADMRKFALRFENGKFGSNVAVDLSNTAVRIGAGFLNIVESDVPYRFVLNFQFENRTGADGNVYHKFDLIPASGKLSFESCLHFRRFVAYHLGFLVSHVLFAGVEVDQGCFKCPYSSICRVSSATYFAIGFIDGLMSSLGTLKEAGIDDRSLKRLYGDALFFLSNIGTAASKLIADFYTDAWRIRLEHTINKDISDSNH